MHRVGGITPLSAAAAGCLSAPGPDDYRSSGEARLKKYFPINVLTEPMMWLLRQKPVRQYIKHELIRILYGSSPSGRPDTEETIYEFMVFLFSPRFLSHCAKVTANTKTVDFGRFPFPKVAFNLFEKEIAELGNPPLKGMRDATEIARDKCNSIKKTVVYKSRHFRKGNAAIELIALRFYWERMDFFEKHKVTFPVTCSVHLCVCAVRSCAHACMSTGPLSN